MILVSFALLGSVPYAILSADLHNALIMLEKRSRSAAAGDATSAAEVVPPSAVALAAREALKNPEWHDHELAALRQHDQQQQLAALQQRRRQRQHEQLQTAAAASAAERVAEKVAARLELGALEAQQLRDEVARAVRAELVELLATKAAATGNDDAAPPKGDSNAAGSGGSALLRSVEKVSRYSSVGKVAAEIEQPKKEVQTKGIGGRKLYYEVIDASSTRRPLRTLHSSGATMKAAAAASMCPPVPALEDNDNTGAEPQLLSGGSGGAGGGNNNNDNKNATNANVQPPTVINTTLVFQCSVNRVFLLNETCRRWQDPIVAIIRIDPGSRNNQLAYLNANLARWKPDCPHLRVLAYRLDDSLDAGSNSQERYPINRLRNIGLDHVATSHALVVDIDFIPSVGLDETIREAITHESSLQRDEAGLVDIVNGASGTWKEGWIVPAFERIAKCNNEKQYRAFMRQASEEGNASFIPRTFKELQACNQMQQCQVFGGDYNPQGHLSSRQDLWLQGKWYTYKYSKGENSTGSLQQSIIKHARTVPCIYSEKYEPYVVLEWCGSNSRSSADAAPYYDERFYGYGKNKIQYMAHLRYMGYQLRVLPKGFLVHHPHPSSPVKKLWNNQRKSRLKAQMDALYPRFLKELEQRYLPDNAGAIIPMCNSTGSK